MTTLHRRPPNGLNPSNDYGGYTLATATIPPDWNEFLEALRSQSTRFLLIGGRSLAFHVEARLTEDLASSNLPATTPNA